MRILYISSWHTTQEYDDLILLTELGLDWFSAGYYIDPKNPMFYRGQLFRKPIDKEPNRDLIEEFRVSNPRISYFQYFNYTKEFIDKFDAIIVNFSSPCPLNLQRIIHIAKDKPIIFRTYGHQPPSVELYLKAAKSTYDLHLIRNSPTEETIPEYAGHSAIIRGYVDENVYKDWYGSKKSTLTFANDFNARIHHQNYDCYRLYLTELKNKIPNTLYGSGNGVLNSKSPVSWDTQIALYKEFMVYFSLNSPPANFPYSFIEALMTGMPIVAVGPKLGNAPGMNSYEVPKIINHGENGFYFDTAQEMIDGIRELLRNRKLRTTFSSNARATALSLFSKKEAKEKLETLFKEIGIL